MKKIKITAVILIILSFLLSGISILYSLLSGNEGDSLKSLTIANHAYDTIYDEIMRPLTVSKTMAYDTFLRDKLENEEKYTEQEMASFLSDYLSTIKEKFNYSSAFVVSEKTRRYYTPGGISKILNPQKVPYDIWYPLFINSNLEYDLDTDRDQLNEYLWTVFINIKVTGKDGTLLGVCGVGVVMENLQSIITSLEDEFDIKINLIDLEGLVRIDTNTTNIENAYISEAIADGAGSERFSFSRKGLSNVRMVRFMKDLEWYIVVQGRIERRIITPKFFVWPALFLILILAVFFLIAGVGTKEKQKQSEIQDTLEDSITGLPNRNYFKEAYGEMGIFTTTRYKTIAFVDIDNFDSLSADMDGNEILRKLIRVSNATFWNQGQLLKWDKDEFLAILETGVRETKENFAKLCSKIEREIGITLSVGVAEINLSDTIKVNYYRAIQACYAAKENGGNGVVVHV
ncbi:MAG: diguanylate cyclase [Treponema sp.]|nr:diguanylate cyclase [Treponema sp.]